MQAAIPTHNRIEQPADVAPRSDTLTLDVELLENRIAPARLVFGLPIGPWRVEDCCT